MSEQGKRAKWLHKLLIIGLISGYTIFVNYYYNGYLSYTEFVYVSVFMTMSLTTLTLLLLLKSDYVEIVLPKVNLGKFMYILPYITFLCMFFEVWVKGRSEIFSVITLSMVFTVMVFSRYDSLTVPMAFSSLATLISVLYGVYTPSFGNDTWRDSIQASQIIVKGTLQGLTIVHEAHTFPPVSLLYAIHSMIAGMNTLWSSSIMGLLYLSLLSLWVYSIARRLNPKYSHIAVLLTLSTPLIILWSVWFIPQTYSLLMALPLLFLDLHPLILVILTVALTLGHGGTALWTTLVLILLASVKKVLGDKIQVSKFVNIKLITVVLFFTVYAIYTTLSMVLKGTVSNVFKALILFLEGERKVTGLTSLKTNPIRVLDSISVMVFIALGLVLLLESRNNTSRLLAFISTAGLSIAFIGAVVDPMLDSPRYLGLTSITILAILSPQVLEILAKRVRIGIYYGLSLVLLAIISFGFSGIFMPGNPYTANPYSAWSLSGLVTYSEAEELENIATLLCCNNYLIDWRAGHYLAYKYLWICPLFKGFHNSETQSSFIFAGSYGLLVTPEYLEKSNQILILRISGLQMPEAFASNILEFVQEQINKDVYYSSKHFKVVKLNFYKY